MEHAACAGLLQERVRQPWSGYATARAAKRNCRGALLRIRGLSNGCQLMVELGLLGGDADNKVVEMHHNKSGKFESEFVSLRICLASTMMFKLIIAVF